MTDAPRSDAGNAERLVAAHGSDVRFVPGVGWHRWDGHRWQLDEDGAVMRLARDVARAELGRALEHPDDDERKRAVAWALKSEEARRLRAAVDLASTDAAVIARVDQLDADPFAFTAANGTIDLRTGRLRDPRREDLATRMSSVPFDPDARAPRWERFLAEIFDGDTDLIGFVARWAGYCLTGDTREHVLAVLHGSGCNGKSTFVETLRRLLGEHAVTAPFQTFERTRDGRGPRDDLARLRGARLVTASESGSGSRLDEAIVKEITGGDTIAARPLYGRYFEFRPAFKLVLTTNHRPRVDGDDDAIWRRLRLVPFEQSFTGREDRTLAADLHRELPGILAWAVRGALAWKQDGLGTPAAVLAATDSYRTEEDALGAFIAERCTTTGQTTVADLRAAYEAWCERNGERPVSGKELTRRLKARGITTGRTKSARLYVGIALTVTGDTGDTDPGNLLTPAREGDFPTHLTPLSPVTREAPQ